MYGCIPARLRLLLNESGVKILSDCAMFPRSKRNELPARKAETYLMSILKIMNDDTTLP